MSDTIELVTFKTIPGVTPADLVAAAEPIGAWARAQPGFRYRSLSVDGNEQWRDIIYWDSMDNARRASEQFMDVHGDSAFLALIDAESVVMNHSLVQQAIMSENCNT